MDTALDESEGRRSEKAAEISLCMDDSTAMSDEDVDDTDDVIALPEYPEYVLVPGAAVAEKGVDVEPP